MPVLVGIAPLPDDFARGAFLGPLARLRRVVWGKGQFWRLATLFWVAGAILLEK